MMQVECHGCCLRPNGNWGKHSSACSPECLTENLEELRLTSLEIPANWNGATTSPPPSDPPNPRWPHDDLWTLEFSPRLFDFFTAKAAFNMIVDHAHGLHKGIACGGADKAPAAFFEIFRQGR